MTLFSMKSSSKKTPKMFSQFTRKKISLFTLFLFCFSCSSLFAEDDTGTYSRIISLYPAHTENIILMGGESSLVAASTSDTHTRVGKLPKLSYKDDLERFIALSPDLVLIRPMIERAYPRLVNNLKKAGIAVISIQPRTIEQMTRYWIELGKLCGHEKDAKKMVKGFQNALAEIEEKVNKIPIARRPGVYFQAMHKQMRTFSPSSIALFCLTQAGGRNVASDARARFNTNIASYSKEQLLSHGPEIDVFLAQYGRMNRVSIEMIKNEPGFSIIKAVRENRIFLIDETIVSRPTPRLIEGINRIHTLLFPVEKKR